MALVLENVLSALIMKFLRQKNQKTFNVGNYDEAVFIREKNVFIFLKTFFTKWEGAKYAGSSRPSCYKINFPFLYHTTALETTVSWGCKNRSIISLCSNVFQKRTPTNSPNQKYGQIAQEIQFISKFLTKNKHTTEFNPVSPFHINTCKPFVSFNLSPTR